MKTPILQLAVFLLLTCPLIAQTSQLPYALRSHRADLPTPVSKHLQELEQRLLAGPLERTLTKAIADSMYLDSTITYHPVDVGEANPVFVPSSRSVFMETGPGQLRIVESVFEEDAWHFSTQTRTQHDELGRVITQFAEAFDRDIGTWLPVSRLRTYPRAVSTTLLDSLYVEMWIEEDNSWQRVINVRHTYGEMERLQKSTTSLILDGEELTFEDEYSYDENGDNTEIHYYLISDSERLLTSQETREYSNHLVTNSTLFLYDQIDEDLLPEEYITYTYTGTGLTDSITTYLWDDAQEDWSLSSLNNYDYNGLDAVTDEYTATFDIFGDTSLTWIKNTYVAGTTYLETVEEFAFVEDLNSYRRDAYTRYFYREASTAVNDRPRLTRQLAIWPNPTAHSVEINLQESALLHLYDQTGRLILTRNWAPGQDRFDLPGLSPGIYQLSARTAEGVYGARLIKN
ncbi:hypothetical protein GGR28_001729 [Lewinella aquimaris]|uniref:Secretion system C-terminal sorting domain-containing protein n=1 Tax=Neolewinella aquimaris TaxID=1835722 RepID=A0A840E5W9_9BACT|nr:T9SS type A sorting domain-containing protein [Neolewinella aquimaris]MBB4079112.1 hypothetical protein [Neolewinella aquimaris]